MLRIIWGVSRVHMKKSLRQARTGFVLILLLIVADFYLRGFRSFCAATDTPVSFWGAVALFLSAPNSACLQIILFALLTTDLPGKDSAEPYLLIRSGRSGWLYGKIAAALSCAVLYTMAVNAACLIALNGSCTFAQGWGKILYTACRTDAAEAYEIKLYVSAKVIGNYSAQEAWLKSVMLHLIMYSFLGVWILAINAWSGKVVGNLIAIGMAFISQELGGFDLSYQYLRFSPCSLASLETIGKGNLDIRPSLAYCVLFLAAGTVIGIVLLTSSKRKINIYPQ